MTEEEKKIITREKLPGRLAQGHKIAALMKKRKAEILHNKKQSTVQSTVQSIVQSLVQSIEQSLAQHSVQSAVQLKEQPSVQSNDTYVYGVGLLAVLAIGVCVFLHIMPLGLKIKKPSMKNKASHQNDVLCFRKIAIGMVDVFAGMEM